MSRISGAILVMVVLLASGLEPDIACGQFGGEGDAPRDAAAESVKPVESQSASDDEKAGVEESDGKTIASVLKQPLKSPVHYESLPLNELVEQLSEEYDIPILLDMAAVDGFGISPETEVTVNLRNISLKSALNLILQQPGLEELAYTIEDEVLLITTEEAINERLSVAVYRVDDLVSKFSVEVDEGPYSSLKKVITSSVEYDSWMGHGTGEGEILLMQPGLLIVSQTHRVHEQIDDLLEKIRRAAAAVEQTPIRSAHSGRY